jgi:DnaJ-class molecular chaperone
MTKQFQDLDYYELLRIPYSASPFEIRQAYKNILSIYEENSLATYSLFTDVERKKILAKIENAFLTLIDGNKRKSYDNTLIESGDVPRSELAGREHKKAIPLIPINKMQSSTSISTIIRQKVQERQSRGGGELAKSMLKQDLICGRDLKNLRESLGIELEEIFQATKISPTTLQAIEKDDLANLPPKVYLKSFLKSYAEVLQLDAKQVVAGYLKHISHQSP